jgi:hypothetical protein
VSEQVGPPELITYDPNVPQCGCNCHNLELGCAHADIDHAGNYWPGQDVRDWIDNPRYVDRREIQHAMSACSSCKPLHALAFSSDPMKAWELEKNAAPAPKIERAKRGGPHGQCEPGCRFCKNHDSVFDEHHKK